MEITKVTTGTTVALGILIIVSWIGFKKYNKPSLWLVFVPTFSIVHAMMGWYILALAFQYDSKPEQTPLYAKILAPTYISVSLFAYPLEAIGLGDDIAYSIAFGLNAICIALLIVFIVQWVKKRNYRRPNNGIESAG